MAKPEWGTKRSCLGCGVRFYDLMRVPVICPKCQSPVEIDTPFRVRRAASAVEAKPKRRAPEVAVEVEDRLNGEEAGTEDLDGGDDDESGLIEDASDLGEDDDDMAEVIEHLDEKDEA